MRFYFIKTLYTLHSLHSLHLPITRRPYRPANNLTRVRRHQGDGQDSDRAPQEADADNKPEIEVVAEEGDATEVDGSGTEDGEYHDGVPRRDLSGDHGEFVENQYREGDGDHLGEVVGANQDLAKTLDHAALVDGDEDPDEEGAVGQRAARRELLVELRVEVG